MYAKTHYPRPVREEVTKTPIIVTDVNVPMASVETGVNWWHQLKGVSAFYNVVQQYSRYYMISLQREQELTRDYDIK